MDIIGWGFYLFLVYVITKSCTKNMVKVYNNFLHQYEILMPIWFTKLLKMPKKRLNKPFYGGD